MEYKPYDHDVPPGHPSEEKRGFHNGDHRLRRNGFAVHARPEGRPAVWARGGDLYSEAQAHAVCDRREQEAGS